MRQAFLPVNTLDGANTTATITKMQASDVIQIKVLLEEKRKICLVVYTSIFTLTYFGMSTSRDVSVFVGP